MITDANGHPAVTMTYDAQGRVATQKDALGLTTGRQTTLGPYGAAATCPAGATAPCTATTVTYPQSSFDAKAMTVVDTYDANGRLVQRVSTPSNVAGEAYTETYTYTTSGFRNSVTDANGKTTMFCYDTGYNGQPVGGSLGNLTRTISPPPGSGPNPTIPLVTLFKYDGKNNLIQSISPKGVNNGTSVTCATDLTPAGIIDPNLYRTDLTYDATNAQLLSTTRKYVDPDLTGTQTATTKFEYGDAANPGRVTRIIPPRGNTGSNPDYTYATTLAYYTSTSSATQAGMLQSATDPLGNKTTYTYDAVGRKLSLVDPNGNASGGVPGDHTWSFTYDSEDRLTSASAPPTTSGGAVLKTQTQYDAVGNRIVVVDANGQITTYEYDVRDSLSKVHQTPNNWPLSNPTLPPSPTNPPNPATNPPGEIVTAYSYDNLGNLSRVLRASGDATNERATDYTYDGLNRVRKETQYPSWPTTTPTLVTQTSYDGNGNRTQLQDAFPTPQLTTFSYDTLNRLTSIAYSQKDPSTSTTANVTYTYLCKCQAGGATKIGSRGVIQLMSADLRRVVA
jgi:YD repeat-containing protein